MVKYCSLDSDEFDLQFRDENTLLALLVIIRPLLVCEVHIAKLRPSLRSLLVLLLALLPAPDLDSSMLEC